MSEPDDHHRRSTTETVVGSGIGILALVSMLLWVGYFQPQRTRGACAQASRFLTAVRAARWEDARALAGGDLQRDIDARSAAAAQPGGEAQRTLARISQSPRELSPVELEEHGRCGGRLLTDPSSGCFGWRFASGDPIWTTVEKGEGGWRVVGLHQEVIPPECTPD